MSALLITVHIIVCIILILIVLLQTGKGADMGAAFGGGGSQTLFGATGGATVLGKATTFAAVVFMLTSLSLAYVSNQGMSGSIIADTPASEDSVDTETATRTVPPPPEAGDAGAADPQAPGAADATTAEEADNGGGSEQAQSETQAQ